MTKVFFICCVLFLLASWIALSTEHGKQVGKSILDTLKKLFAEDNVT